MMCIDDGKAEGITREGRVRKVGSFCFIVSCFVVVVVG